MEWNDKSFYDHRDILSVASPPLPSGEKSKAEMRSPLEDEAGLVLTHCHT
jgi:hypothetical protein